MSFTELCFMTRSSSKAPFRSDVTRCAPEAHLLHPHLQRMISSREKEQLWCQRWQNFALAQQKMMICLFTTMLHLHRAECFKEVSAINWMLCLREAKVLENNKVKKRILILSHSTRGNTVPRLGKEKMHK